MPSHTYLPAPQANEIITNLTASPCPAWKPFCIWLEVDGAPPKPDRGGPMPGFPGGAWAPNWPGTKPNKQTPLIAHIHHPLYSPQFTILFIHIYIYMTCNSWNLQIRQKCYCCYYSGGGGWIKKTVSEYVWGCWKIKGVFKTKGITSG